MENLHNLSDAVGIIHAKALILINRTGALSITVQRINQAFINITRNASDFPKINVRVVRKHGLLGTM